MKLNKNIKREDMAHRNKNNTYQLHQHLLKHKKNYCTNTRYEISPRHYFTKLISEMLSRSFIQG